MAMFSELVATAIILVTKLLSLCKLICMFCLTTTLSIIQTWVELVTAAVFLHLSVIWKAITWMVALISLPGQILTTLQRQKRLEQHLREMQFELETLVWERKELEDHLHTAIKERRIMESMLIELEEDHENVITKIELLEGELQDIKDENLQLKEIQGKAAWSFKGHDDAGKVKSIGLVDSHNVPYDISSWKTTYKGSSMPFQDLMKHKDAWEDKSKNNAELINLLKSGSKVSEFTQPSRYGIISRDIETNEVLDQKREVALSQSLFSAILSLLVGVIIWKAEDPCMPLVVALFTVVGMSLKSVVQFFSTIKNKPASDAVALLSFNWFILGTLTYPTLPIVARMLAPLALSLVDRIANWLGVSFH